MRRTDHTTATDARLIAASRDDADAFRALYDRYAERVHGYHRRRCGDRQAALDPTAETFARAWVARTRFRDEAGGSAAPWLFAIARHVLIESVRGGRMEGAAMERLGVRERWDAPPSTADPAEAWLDGADELLDRLPAGQREAVRLRVVDDLAYPAVADALATTPEAARVRVHRGLAALRQRFRTEEMSR
ncbi:MAG: RNA polymerase sigma factor [Thermoleophilia bacterium]